MKRRPAWAIGAGFLVLQAAAAWGEASLPVSARQAEHRVVVEVAGEEFTAYKTNPTQKYPYFYPVNGPLSGESVTTESSQPYPHHQSLFFGCDHVNDGNYWQEDIDRGQIRSQTTAILENGPDRVVIRDESRWQKPGHDPIIRDTRTFTITAPDPRTRYIDAEFRLTPLVDIHIRKTNHSLFAARMAPELSVTAGATLVNAEGKTAESGTFGEASPWCDYYGTRGGITEGLAILEHPDNPWFPSPWFTRDYGFFSPTPMNWLDEKGLDLPKGEDLVLRYRVVVHAGSTEEAAIEETFQAYGANGRR
jgi:hypothetical protein